VRLDGTCVSSTFMFVDARRPDKSKATSLIGEFDSASVSSSTRRRSLSPAIFLALACDRSPNERQL
jgi:hypothetical protein